MHFRERIRRVSAGPAAVALTAAMVVTLYGGTAVAAMLAVGDSFPDWELTDDRGAQISSADLAGGRYLIWFYPKASTPG